jgi:hypothetical protein
MEEIQMKINFIVSAVAAILMHSTSYATSLNCELIDQKNSSQKQCIDLKAPAVESVFKSADEKQAGFILRKEEGGEVTVSLKHPAIDKDSLPKITFKNSDEYPLNFKMEGDPSAPSNLLSCVDESKLSVPAVLKPITCNIFSSKNILLESKQMSGTILTFFRPDLGADGAGFKIILLNSEIVKVAISSPYIGDEYLPILYLNPSKPFNVTITTTSENLDDDLKLECKNI